MKNYKTAHGKVVDMAALAAKNERVRAVGNMKVNARGDTIDATGKVIVPVTQKVTDNYAKTVGNRSANVVKKPPQSAKTSAPTKAPAVPKELTAEELDLESSFNDDADIEAIKAAEVAKVKK